MAHTLTVKGQVTIPKAVREHLGLRPGSRVEFTREADGRVTLRRAEPSADFAARLEALRSIARSYNGMSTEEVMRMTRGEDWGRK
jgi:AbrB family looped-hinge helix DNA binding protein